MTNSPLILVIGLSGSGKTTLVRYVVNNLHNLEYLKTVTTRPKRNGEDTFEYTFVSEDEYDNLYKQSNKWDESIIHGFKYGVDVANFSSLKNTTNYIVIVNTFPNIEIINSFSEIYNCQTFKIFVDTPKSVCSERLNRERYDKSRTQVEKLIEVENIKAICDYVFEPSLDLSTDLSLFFNLIKSILL